MKDLVVLVADKNARFTIEGLLSRTESLNISPIEFDVYTHPEHDPGVYHKAADILRPLQNQYRFALVFLDKEGSGQEHKSIDEIEAEIKNSLNRSGWENRSEVIVFDPELESWAWVNSTHVAKSLGWERYTT